MARSRDPLPSRGAHRHGDAYDAGQEFLIVDRNLGFPDLLKFTSPAAARPYGVFSVAVQCDRAQQQRAFLCRQLAKNSLPMDVQCSGTREPGSKRKPKGQADSTRSR